MLASTKNFYGERPTQRPHRHRLGRVAGHRWQHFGGGPRLEARGQNTPSLLCGPRCRRNDPRVRSRWRTVFNQHLSCVVVSLLLRPTALTNFQVTAASPLMAPNFMGTISSLAARVIPFESPSWPKRNHRHRKPLRHPLLQHRYPARNLRHLLRRGYGTGCSVLEWSLLPLRLQKGTGLQLAVL